MARDRSAPLLFVKLRASEGEEFRVVSDQILGFKYTDSERKADLCRLQVDNSDLSNFDDPVWRKGGILVVQWGYPGKMAPARECVITTVKGFRTLEVEASARSVEMNRIVRSRSFEGLRVSDVARLIADDAGFDTDAQHVDSSDPTVPILTQARMTDAQFLRRWASRLGWEFYVDFDGFHFHARRLGERPVRVLHYYTDPGAGDFLEDPQIENDITARPGRVRVRGRDPVERRDIDESADNESDSDRDVLAPLIELIDPETGNARTVERRVASEDVVPTADATPEEARQRARGRFRRAQQTAVKMRAPIVGDPHIFAKSVVQVEGMGRRLSIRYYIQEVDHDLSTNGYVCHLRMVSDGHGGHSTTSQRATGLSLLESGGRGTGGGRGTSGDVVRGLQNALREAEASGDTRSAAMLQTALAGYQRSGGAARAETQRVLAAVSRNPEASAETREAAATTFGAISQRGEETESGGRLNRQEAEEGSEESLTPVEVVDPETGETRTVFRQNPPRGTPEESS